MSRLLAFAMLSVSAITYGQESWLKPHVEKLKKTASEQLVNCRDELKLAKSGRVNANYRGPKRTDKGYVFSNGNEKKEAIAYFEKSLANCQSVLKGDVNFPLPDGELKLGDIGYPSGDEHLVTDIASPTAAIVDINTTSSRITKRASPRPSTLEAGSADAARAFNDARFNQLLGEHYKTRVLWIEIPTTGWIDDKTVKVDRPLLIIGTKQYDTVIGGSNTILHAKALSAEDLAEFKKLMTQH